MKLEFSDMGELVCAKQGEREYLHGGGKKEADKTEEDLRGWQHSEIVMFPVVGSVEGFKLTIDGKTYNHDQHGISRYLPFNTVHLSQRCNIFGQNFYEDSMPNPKTRTGKPNPETLDWPYPFSITKSFGLIGGSSAEESTILDTNLTVRNIGEQTMPYMLGWHPAFKTFNGKGVFHRNFSVTPTATLDEVIEASKEGAYIMENTRRILYQDGRNSITMETNDFSHMMLWSPGKEMVCIEPITHLPGTDINNAAKLEPGQQKRYSVTTTFE